MHPGKLRPAGALSDYPEHVQIVADIGHVASQLLNVPKFLAKSAPIGKSLLAHSVKV